MLKIKCKNCNKSIGDSFLFQFKTINESNFDLIAEKNEKTSTNFIEAFSNSNECACIYCKSILCTLDSNKYTFKRDTIYFDEFVYDKQTRYEYDSNTNPLFFPLIKQATSNKNPIENSESVLNLPNLNYFLTFNIGGLIKEKPSREQLELYLACLNQNTIVYMPKISNLVISMIFACMKKLNPNKKCIYLSENMTKINMLSAKLKKQTNLQIYFNKKKNKKNKLIYCDLCLFNLDSFFNELSYESNINSNDISCIIIDESALNSKLEYLIEKFTTNKPRLIGLLTSSIEISILNKLTNLIQAKLYTTLDEEKLKQSQFEFSIVEEEPTNQMINLLNSFIVSFVTYLNKNKMFNLLTDQNELNSFIQNDVLNDKRINTNEKRFVCANLLLKILDTINIKNILGLEHASNNLTRYLSHLISHSNSLFTINQINSINHLIDSLKIFNGVSNKFKKLTSILSNNQTKKIVICIKNKATVNYLHTLLCNDPQFRNQKPKYLIHSNERIVKSFTNGDCNVLILAFKLQLKADIIVLFDGMWLDPLVSHHNSIVICNQNEELSYQKSIESELKLINFINKSTKIKINNESIDQLINLIDYNYSDRLTKIKFTIKIYIDESKTDSLFNYLSRLETFNYRIDSSNESFATESKLFTKLEAFNLVLRSSYVANAVYDDVLFELKTVKQFMTNLTNCACQLYTSNQENNSNKIKANSIQFGNLSTPFEFFKIGSKFELVNIEVNIDLSDKQIELIKDDFKFQIQFNFIDHIICCDETSDSIIVYIPCRQAPLLYDKKSDNTKDIFFDLFDDWKDQITWIRSCPQINQTSWTFKIRFSLEDKVTVYKAFNSIRGCTFLFSSIKQKQLTYTFDDLRADFCFKSFKMKYVLEVFISQNDYMLNGKIDKEFADKLNEIDPNKMTRILERFTVYLQNSARYEASILPLLDELIEDENGKKNVCVEKYLDSRVEMIRRATVTPLRVIYHFPEPIFSNRILRQFKADKFLRLRFRDEDLSKLNLSKSYTDMSQIYTRIRNLLKNGLNLNDYEFTFLAMSSSQLREHGCWLCSSLNDGISSDKIRERMGDFTNIRCIGKYAARLGQSLSSSIETLETNKFKIIADIKTSDAKYCFTDGVGKLSIKEAEKLNAKYFDGNYASTFQIRFGGFKGVLAAWPSMENAIEFRPSMRKFDSGHNRLDVLNIADYIPCYLNRQVIVILSALGIQDSTFANLQDMMLKRMSGMLIDKHLSAGYIKTYFRNIFSFATNSKEFNYALEPFFRDILKSIYKKHLQGLIDKSRIFVEKGRILMGCIDELGVLKPHEVFIKCDNKLIEDEFSSDINNNQQKKQIIIETRVAVAKNPCMHPGDIRVLNAVNKPELNHLVNCIVFPSRGTRPITSMCSGSDLDGDLYWVTWDPNLVPDKLVDPMEYDAPAAKEKDSPVIIEDIIEFFTNFIKMDQLGRLANAHQALADQSSVLSKECIDIAQAFSYAVDFPKTGYMAELPSSISKAPIKYPDFMQKPGRTYISDKIIGKMYRQCKSIFQNEQIYINESDVDMNPSFILDGHETYLDEAKQLYKQYRIEIDRIMVHFGCTTESELFVGVCDSGSPNDEAKNQKKVSSWSIRKIWQHFREVFFEDFEETNPNDKILQKASAWYVACYSSEENINLKIISFPWLLEDILQKFKNIQNYDTFSYSIVENYLNLNDKKRHYNLFIQQNKFKEAISSNINYKLILTGLNGLFLNLENSADFEFTLLDESADLNTIKSVLTREYKHIVLDGQNLKCYLDSDVTFTIYVNSLNLKSFLYLRQAIFENNILLPIFFTIVNFIQQDAVFLTLEISIELFLEYCLNYFIEKKLIKDVIKEQPVNLDQPDEIYKWHELYDSLSVTNESIKLNGLTGQMLLNFYRDNAFTSDDFYEFKPKFNPDKTYQIRNKQFQRLKQHFFKVFSNLTKTAHIKAVWSLREVTNERNFKKRANQNLDFMLKTPCLYASDSYLLLISNMKSTLDLIKFNLYSGPRMFKHESRDLFKPVLISASFEPDLNTCQNYINNHLITRLAITKAYHVKNKTNHAFTFQVKFGHFYLTKLSNNLMKNYHNISLANLQKDLHFKTIDLNSGKYLSMTPLVRIKYNNKVPNSSNTYSAFNTIIHNDISEINSTLIDHGFNQTINSLYNCYVDLKDILTNKMTKYRLKYNLDFQFKKAELLPVKWAQIDLINSGNKDLSFCLDSTKAITDFKWRDLKETCPFTISDDKIVLNDKYRHFTNVHIKHTRYFIYDGDFLKWQSWLDLDDCINTDDELFKRFQLIISNETIYSDHSDLDGVFQTETQRNKLKICANLTLNELDQTKGINLIKLAWLISKEISKIVI